MSVSYVIGECHCAGSIAGPSLTRHPLLACTYLCTTRLSTGYNPFVGFLAGFGGCWDVAAGCLIVEEAGGVVLDPAGGPFEIMARRVLAGNRHVAHEAAAILGSRSISKTEPGVPKS